MREVTLTPRQVEELQSTSALLEEIVLRTGGSKRYRDVHRMALAARDAVAELARGAGE